MVSLDPKPARIGCVPTRPHFGSPVDAILGSDATRLVLSGFTTTNRLAIQPVVIAGAIVASRYGDRVGSLPMAALPGVIFTSFLTGIWLRAAGVEG